MTMEAERIIESYVGVEVGTITRVCLSLDQWDTDDLEKVQFAIMSELIDRELEEAIQNENQDEEGHGRESEED